MVKVTNKESIVNDKNWSWWPLFPLYPYGNKKTILQDLIPKMVWGVEQLQGLYYVAVPIRLTIVKVPKGLMLINPLPPTTELLTLIKGLEKKYGPVLSIVLPTASGLEHKIAMPAMARSFPKANLWLCPGQWSFPFNLPLSWLGFPPKRTRYLIQNGFPHSDVCEWISLGPIDIGLGQFQEISCFHRPSATLIVTDALVAIDSKPPKLFDFDPTPVLFHSRDSGNEALIDSVFKRKKGWLRVVLFASFLKPYFLTIPQLSQVIKNSFKPGMRNSKSHFGLYPFFWEDGWEDSAMQIVGKNKPLLQVAPVIKRLVFPRAKKEFLKWLDQVSSLNGMKKLVSAHFTSPVKFSRRECLELRKGINFSNWSTDHENFAFLSSVDNQLLKLNIVPKDPVKKLKI